jgi:PAS domain S-box-containing protein
MTLIDRDENPDANRNATRFAHEAQYDPFAAAIKATRMAMLITDPRRDDNPIVFANDAFLALTGYGREELLGANCRFLQGPDTDRETIGALRDAIARKEDINVDILNYRKDGSPFWNALYISPVYSDDGELQFFFSSQLDVSDRKQSEFQVWADKDRFERAVEERTAELKRKTAELQAALEAQTALLHEVDHRVKNNLQMISSLITMQSRTIEDESIRRSLRAMLERVEALSTVHRQLYQAQDITRLDVAGLVREIATDLIAAWGRPVRTSLDLQPVTVPAKKAAPLALIMNELVTNALKHGFDGRDDGEITIAIRPEPDRCSIVIADNGRGLNGVDPNRPGNTDSFGLKMIRAVSRQLGADIEWRDGNPGTHVTIAIPLKEEMPDGKEASR